MTTKRPILGILGAGQLGEMLATAAHRLGLQVALYDSSSDPAAKHWSGLTQGPFDDSAALSAFAAPVDWLTFEFENIPLAVVQQLATEKKMFPPPQSLAASCDRLVEKKMFASLGAKTAKFAAVDHPEILLQAVQHLGVPCVLKTRRFGYDGKGQWVIRDPSDVAAVAKSLHQSNASGGLILEQFIPFDRELSVIAVRGQDGEMVFYDLCENRHEAGILRATKVLTEVDPSLWDQAKAIATSLAEHLNYVGTLVIEFFERDGELIVNEFAPRVHNSGHWTLEGAHTSQFENHVRAVTGLPLGDTTTRGLPFMVNFIGQIPPLPALYQMSELAIYDYGKAARPGRKVGHASGNALDPAGRAAQLESLRVCLESK